jgi:hypothetical protein
MSPHAASVTIALPLPHLIVDNPLSMTRLTMLLRLDMRRSKVRMAAGNDVAGENIYSARGTDIVSKRHIKD